MLTPDDLLTTMIRAIVRLPERDAVALLRRLERERPGAVAALDDQARAAVAAHRSVH